jgi:hypothetical protein
MKKQIISLLGITTVLIGALVFNIYGHYSSKHQTCFAGKYLWGFDIKEICSRPDAGKYSGYNYCVMFMKSKNGGHTLGNTDYEFFTWYMNR